MLTATDQTLDHFRIQRCFLQLAKFSFVQTGPGLNLKVLNLATPHAADLFFAVLVEGGSDEHSAECEAESAVRVRGAVPPVLLVPRHA